MSDYGLSLGGQQHEDEDLDVGSFAGAEFDWTARVSHPAPCRTCGALVPRSHHQLHNDWHAKDQT